VRRFDLSPLRYKNESADLGVVGKPEVVGRITS
jgi:hypothetical protein